MYRKRIDAYIDSKKQEMLEDLKKLVRINSQREDAQPGMPYGKGPAMALDAAEELMRGYGLNTRNYDHYVVTGDLGEGEKELDILAHLDVVPVTDGWTVTEPFEPLVLDGKIYGRGTSDDKGPAIAALYALRAIRELQLPLKKSVRLVLGSDEECGSSDLEYYYSKEKEAPCTFTPDGDFPVINLEKARLSREFEAAFPQSRMLPGIERLKAGDKVNVVPAKAEAVFVGLAEAELKQAAEKAAETTKAQFAWKKQENRIVLSVKGTAAHASTPEAGNNALTALLYLLTLLPIADCGGYRRLCALSRMFPHGDTKGEALKVDMADEESGALTMNLGILDYQDGSLKGAFDSRAPLCATDENLTEKMRKAFADAGMQMEEGAMIPAHHVPADSYFVRTLLESYERYTGIKGKPLAIGGGTYVHELERGVAFGCGIEGVDNHMHGDDEFMELDTLFLSAKIFADVILKLCN
ncbi:MAG: Sapep family Mn(2+)-dependent dipeptidase [Lachnospiraceae bacterium]|nr:Sapep family Mn(2+)-dependent dipeptidase [Lachnospiraceae bacterium]